MVAASRFIEYTLGHDYSQGLTMSVSEVYAESDPQTPLVFILAAGSDPSTEISALAHSLKTVMHPPVSMGQGQEPVARSLISACMTEGGWVLLQNCHLGISFMEDLYLLIQNDTHESFRLWLTTAPSDQFPRALLHVSIKVPLQPLKTAPFSSM